MKTVNQQKLEKATNNKLPIAMHSHRFLFAFFIFCVPSLLYATEDSLSPPASLSTSTRVVRNYIRPTLSFNTYITNVQPLSGIRRYPSSVTNLLLDYRVAEHQFTFFTPVVTRTFLDRKDSVSVNTFHLLFTSSLVRNAPQFSGLNDQHTLSKAGIGLRAIYGFRSKFILFYDASPFVVSDLYRGERNSKFRFATTAIFNWMLAPEFSLRFGFTRTYRFGNRNFQPTFGVRIGRLDGKVYFTAQYPRFAALYYQPIPKLSLSIYSRAYGSLYSISNSDSLYNGIDSLIQFGQFGLANGLRIDYRAGSHFSCFLSSGFSQNSIILFSEQFNNSASRFEQLRPFYRGKMTSPAFFINLGITIRFGKSKTTAGNYLMYDVFDLNNTNDAVDGNQNIGNGDIPAKNTKAEEQKIQYNDVQDLISDPDLY